MDIYFEARESNLQYFNEKVAAYRQNTAQLAAFTTSGFNTFKSNINTTNNAKADSAFTKNNRALAYSKISHSETIGGWVTASSIAANTSLMDEYIEYTKEHNQVIPAGLQYLINKKTKENAHIGTHMNTVGRNQTLNRRTSINNTSLILESDSLITKDIAQAVDSFYSLSYEAGNHGEWERHSQHSQHSKSHDNTSTSTPHDNTSSCGSSCSGCGCYSKYSQYTQHTQYNKTIVDTYYKDTIDDFVPTQPQLYNQSDITAITTKDKITLGYYSYDRNLVSTAGTQNGQTYASSVNSTMSTVKYKIELQKTSGPNTRSWTTIQDSTSETVVINPIDPFGLGWTQTSQSYGDYQIRITPYNSYTSNQVVYSDFKWTAPQQNGTALTVSFNIKANTSESISVTNGSTLTGATLYMDGAVKDGASYNYSSFYNASKQGLYMVVQVTDADLGQYFKGTAKLTSTKTTNTYPITWSNSSTIMGNTSGTLTGYVFVSSSDLRAFQNSANDKLSMTLTTNSYYDSACTVQAGAAQTTTQVSPTNTSLLHVFLNLYDTLNINSFYKQPQTYVTSLPQVVVNINQEPHLTGSFKQLNYAWTKTESTPTTWSTSTKNENVLSPPSEGVWYLHIVAYDKYGATMTTEKLGPIIYSTIDVSLISPTITFFDDSDSVKVYSGFTTKPTFDINYQYRYGYYANGSSTLQYTDWSTNPIQQIDNCGLPNGFKVFCEVKITGIDHIYTSASSETNLAKKLEWCIMNQSASSYNVTSTSAPKTKFHDSNGISYDGHILMNDLTDNLLMALRKDEYFYYKFNNNAYVFKKIIYFDVE